MATAFSFRSTVLEIQSDIANMGDLSDSFGMLLTDAAEILAYPGDIEDRLDELADALDFPDSIVTVLGVAPYGIGTAVKTVDRIASNVSSTLRSQADVMGTVDATFAGPAAVVENLQSTNGILAASITTAALANAEMLQEAGRLTVSLGRQQIDDDFGLAAKMASYQDGAQTWFDARDSLVPVLNAAQSALSSAIASITGLLPDTSLLDDVEQVIADSFAPIVDAMNDIEETLCVEIVITPEIVIPGTDPIYDPIFGFEIWPGTPEVVIPAVTVKPCDVLEFLGDQVAIVQEFVEDAIFGVLDALGFDIFAAIDALEDLLLEPLQPFLDALEDFKAQAAAIVDELGDLLDPLQEQLQELIDGFGEIPDIFSMFENTIEGDAGGVAADDVLTGTTLEDAIYGYSGDDDITGTGGDFMFGGKGNDTLTSVAGDEAYGGQGNDEINGSDMADNLDGGSGRDRISGAGGDDLIIGGNARDVIDGGAGEDEIRGGQGNDLLTGGSEADIFVYDGGEDRIKDFADDEDTLVFSTDFVGLGTTVQDIMSVAEDMSRNRVQFDFGDGNVLILNGIATPAMLVDDIVII